MYIDTHGGFFDGNRRPSTAVEHAQQVDAYAEE